MNKSGEKSEASLFVVFGIFSVTLCLTIMAIAMQRAHENHVRRSEQIEQCIKDGNEPDACANAFWNQ